MMSRNEGTYPSYVKLDLVPDIWPDRYWLSSRVCVACEQRWPDTHLFKVSPCCGSNTIESELAPEMRWPDALKRLLHFRFERWYEEYNDGLTDEQLAWNEVTTNGEVDEKKIRKGLGQFLDDLTRSHAGKAT